MRDFGWRSYRASAAMSRASGGSGAALAVPPKGWSKRRPPRRWAGRRLLGGQLLSRRRACPRVVSSSVDGGRPPGPCGEWVPELVELRCLEPLLELGERDVAPCGGGPTFRWSEARGGCCRPLSITVDIVHVGAAGLRAVVSPRCWWRSFWCYPAMLESSLLDEQLTGGVWCEAVRVRGIHWAEPNWLRQHGRIEANETCYVVCE